MGLDDTGRHERTIRYLGNTISRYRTRPITIFPLLYYSGDSPRLTYSVVSQCSVFSLFASFSLPCNETSISAECAFYNSPGSNKLAETAGIYSVYLEYDCHLNTPIPLWWRPPIMLSLCCFYWIRRMDCFFAFFLDYWITDCGGYYTHQQAA